MTAIVVTTGEARADGDTMHNPNSGTLNAGCAGCHRVHTAANANLLMQSDVVALCKTCHGSSGTGSDLNVDLGKTNAGGLALLGGGFQQTLMDTADPSRGTSGGGTGAHVGVGAARATTSIHDVGVAGLPIWGNSTTGWSTSLASFTCANCHDPHGGSDTVAGVSGKPTYRILRVTPTGSGATTPAAVTDEGSPKHYTTTDYFNPRAGLVAPSTPSSNPVSVLASLPSGGISTWCSQCHKAYYQQSFPEEDPVTHLQVPNGTVGLYAGNYMHSNGDIRVSGTPPVTSAATRTCVRCHVAHGTSAVMNDSKATTGATGVTYPDGSLAAPGKDSRLLKMDDRGICRKCHPAQ